MFRKDGIGRRGGGVLIYVKDTIPAYEVQLQEKADCNEAIWCNLVTGHTLVIIGVVYRCPNITKHNNEKIHNAINEVSKGDCIIMGDFNHGNIKWDTLESTGVEDVFVPSTGQFPNSTCVHHVSCHRSYVTKEGSYIMVWLFSCSFTPCYTCKHTHTTVHNDTTFIR